jgi:hypothetical protein
MKQRAHLKTNAVPIDPTPLRKTHKLAIDLRSPITANSPPNTPSRLQTATHSTMMTTEHYQSISPAGSNNHTDSSRAGPSSHAGPSTSTGPSTNTLPNLVHDQTRFNESWALAIAKEKKQMAHPATMGTTSFRGATMQGPARTWEYTSESFHHRR